MAPPRRIEAFDFAPLDIELNEPFGIATGVQEHALNALVRLRLADGSQGLGEAAPFEAVNGETQAQALSALERIRDATLGLDAAAWRRVAASARSAAAAAPSAVCAFETALLDALCRSARLSMFEFFGGSEPTLTSDVTIPTGTPRAAAQAAERAQRDGYEILKVKVGGASLEHDRRRLRASLEAAPGCQLLLDANAALSVAEAIELVQALGRDRQRIALFEQPTARGDHRALRQVETGLGLPVAADESARDANDVAELARQRACSVVNLKISKSGVLGTLRMIETAKAHGLRLMIGGMVESELSMTMSACLAGGVGGFEFVDLDTPLFMRNSPMRGGMRRGSEDGSRSRLGVGHITQGHGVDCDF